MTDEILANQEGSYISLDKENVPYVVTVSYTHLDVYKRQCKYIGNVINQKFQRTYYSKTVRRSPKSRT